MKLRAAAGPTTRPAAGPAPGRPQGPPPELSVRDVTVRFAGLTALDTVSFTVAPGTVHALIGPNGAGKSTCFNVLSGLYRPASGQVTLGGTPSPGSHPTASPPSAWPAPSRTSSPPRAPWPTT